MALAAVAVSHSVHRMTDALHQYFNETGILIRRCHQINQALFYNEVGQWDLTPVQVSTLRVVEDYPGIDQRRLAQVISVDEATTGGVVRRLVERGLLSRESDTKDRRMRRLTITNAGVTALRAVAPGLQKLQDKLLGPLNREEAETLKSLLRRLTEAHHELAQARVGIVRGKTPRDPSAPV